MAGLKLINPVGLYRAFNSIEDYVAVEKWRQAWLLSQDTYDETLRHKSANAPNHDDEWIDLLAALANLRLAVYEKNSKSCEQALASSRRHLGEIAGPEPHASNGS